jgi:uncharacterized protein (DUF362 family)
MRRVPAWLQQSWLVEECKRAVSERLGRSSKMAMHQSIPVINLNLAVVASCVWPHLAVIDGWEAMEGAGPTQGTAVAWRVAMAGTDALAVDTLTTHLMGFDPAQVGYMAYCRDLGLGTGDIEDIDTVGCIDPATVRRTLKPHPALERQLAWSLPGAERYLQRCCA